MPTYTPQEVEAARLFEAVALDLSRRSKGQTIEQMMELAKDSPLPETDQQEMMRLIWRGLQRPGTGTVHIIPESDQSMRDHFVWWGNHVEAYLRWHVHAKMDDVLSMSVFVATPEGVLNVRFYPEKGRVVCGYVGAHLMVQAYQNARRGAGVSKPVHLSTIVDPNDNQDNYPGAYFNLVQADLDRFLIEQGVSRVFLQEDCGIVMIQRGHQDDVRDVGNILKTL